MERNIAFVKMHGAGNDFLMIDDRDSRLDLSPATIAALCDRHRGVGGDGLILIRPSASSDFAMRYYNSDGTEAELCGNGSRCAAAFAFEHRIAERTMRFETGSGIVDAEVFTRGVRIGVGEVASLRLNVALASSKLVAHYGVCGVPHAVVVDEHFASLPPDEFVRAARAIRRDPAFGGAGANVNAVTLREGSRFAYRTYERGVEAETLACGTGAVVTSVVLAHLGLATPPVTCETAGGDVLEVDFDAAPTGATRCRLTGPVAVAFDGTFRMDEYRRS
jgi:diaminopimelate epimerase